MGDKFNEIMGNLRKPSPWVRIFFMIAYSIVIWVIALVILVIMIAQIIFSFTTGSPNNNLQDFSKAIVSYILQILKYLLYSSEDKPFPFSNFPVTDSEESNISPSDPVEKKPIDIKMPAKKAFKRKSAKKPKADS